MEVIGAAPFSFEFCFAFVAADLPFSRAAFAFDFAIEFARARLLQAA